MNTLASMTAAQSGSSITTRHLSKSFNGTTVLQPTDLEIPAGQILVLLGPSGCGKTTLLRLIAGLEQPDGPDMIRFDGDDVSRVPIEKRNVGMVFQSYALFPNMTVAENVAYGLKVRRVERTQREAETRRLLALVGLEEYADRRISAVSGGQRQRTALARALAIKPRVLLLDEPLAALDAVLRERLRVEIGLLLREFGITAVYVTHDQAEAMAIGDRIAVMQKGRIAQIDVPQEIYHRPANDFVADFVGTMNRVAGRVENGVLSIGAGETLARLNVGGPDRATTLCFRPEAARLASADGTISARVAATTFFGATQRLVAEVSPECRLQLDLPSNLSFTPGQVLAFEIDPAAILEFRTVA
ncbi:ABC transporter ATP-binding protein [Mesorhizobium sp. VK22B]|uniref:ABC transporter ATP-binding protein n=1 Tax=Mesorhizobium captivum TaxID=3072319 RepID=A0ABU4YZT0_9HYPH|nr:MULTISPECIES: ABC transporter ATP-binding protein [unclassified Mesorhizobium]MDX8492480.1 ABC transporter ATP-binding protein [Mesorhizobium sp. VK22B]MDX8505569.1 ABC transporter ATP-binding protein [Mesorhizobium sp. VK22E]